MTNIRSSKVSVTCPPQIICPPPPPRKKKRKKKKRKKSNVCSYAIDPEPELLQTLQRKIIKKKLKIP